MQGTRYFFKNELTNVKIKLAKKNRRIFSQYVYIKNMFETRVGFEPAKFWLCSKSYLSKTMM